MNVDKLTGIALLCLSAVVLMFGCAGVNFVPPDECQGADSLILKRIPDPQGASFILQVANLELLKHNAYSRKQALETIKTLQDFVDLDVTYADMVAYVMSKFVDFNHEYGGEILLASEYLRVLNEPLPISSCDKALIKIHLEKQKRLVLSCR